MNTLEEIRDLLKRFTAGEIQTFPAEVVSVDTDKYTAIVKPASDPELKVRLKAAINSKKPGFVLVPKVGSTVLVALILNDSQSGYICAIDEVDQVEIRSEFIQINEGSNGGLIVHEQLLNEYNKTKESVDALLDLFNNWVVAPTDGGGALKTLATTLLEGKTTGDLSEITNNKVTH